MVINSEKRKDLIRYRILLDPLCCVIINVNSVFSNEGIYLDE